MTPRIVHREIAVNDAALAPLAAASRAEGYRFVDRMIAKASEQAFDGVGETFWGAFADGTLVACGGISIDPYCDSRLGRLRHVYVLPPFRRQGIARDLVRHLTTHASAHFPALRLRTSDAAADAFYEAIGFARTDGRDATHRIELTS